MMTSKEVKMKYRISVQGCDDSTTIVKELTEEELKLIQSVAKEITATSTYMCMPIMEIELIENEI